MKELIKPKKLRKGDTIATISPCNGWAGDADVRWKYELGVKRLNEIGLNVVSAPNSLKGSACLSENPKARAEDFMWAFENKDVRAVIANIGGNDSIKVIPFIDTAIIENNSKIFMGYSDVINLHILCYKCGLSTFYGDNLLSCISEAQGWNKYSKHWFEKVLFDSSVIGVIEPSDTWTYEKIDYADKNFIRTYFPNEGYELLQGSGTVQGRLFGGLMGLSEFENTASLSADDFKDTILFIESIPMFFTAKHIIDFLKWLDKIGALQVINGIIIGKANERTDFAEQKKAIKDFLQFNNLSDLSVLYGLNFGHSSPTFILPYGAKAEINCINKSFTILDSGVD